MVIRRESRRQLAGARIDQILEVAAEYRMRQDQQTHTCAAGVTDDGFHSSYRRFQIASEVGGCGSNAQTGHEDTSAG